MIKTGGCVPKKRFGQNFLHDRNIISKIIRVIDPKPTDHFVEIGPGQGALTKELLPLVAKLEAVELDRDLIPVLTANCKEFSNLTIHQADALVFEVKELGTDSLRVVGNLPYNISTPLIFHFLGQLSKIKDLHFMLQKEVAQRIAAVPGNKEYGRLSVMVQYFCQPELLLAIKPAAFFPVPKVDSCFIRLTPHQVLPCQARDLALLTEVVRQAFGQRRKTISNSLRGIVTREQLISLEIDPMLRAENLTVADFVKIANGKW